MAAYRRVYDLHHLQADCQEPGSAPEPYARQSSMGYLYLTSFTCGICRADTWSSGDRFTPSRRTRLVSRRASVCLSVCFVIFLLHAAAVGLLLSAQQAGDVNRCCLTCSSSSSTVRCSAANLSSVALTADVESWRQTCYI